MYPFPFCTDGTLENIFQLLSKIHPNDSCAVCVPVHGQRHNLIIHLEDNKSDIGWGSQIRSYVLDYFMDKGITFPYCVGVSAGACNGLSYLSQQRGRAKLTISLSA